MTIGKSLVAFAVALIVTVSLYGRVIAQTQTPEVKKPQTSEVEQLKQRLQQLEETVRELKGQITAIEDTKTNPAPQVVSAAYTEPAPSVPVAKPQDPKGESTFEVYGFAMLDAGYQFKQNDPDWFDVVRPTKLPSFANEFAPNGNTYFGVRQSRLGIKSSTPTKYGELKTQFEFELFGTGAQAGQTIFRLRHGCTAEAPGLRGPLKDIRTIRSALGFSLWHKFLSIQEPCRSLEQ